MAIVTEKVLVVKTSSLGDIMHGLQLAQTLKENDPGIEITWVVRSRFEPLVRACTAVDSTVTFYRTRGIAEFANLCKRLRGQRFDLVLDLQGLARSGLMTFFSKAPRKVGRSDAREGATLFYKELVPLPQGIDSVHPVDILLEFCRAFGFEPQLRGAVEFSLKDSSDLGIPQDHRLVTIVAEGRRSDMEWSHFAALAEVLLKKNSLLSIQLVASRVYEWIAKLQSDFGNRVFVMRSKDPLKLAGCLQNTELLIANDSDAVHMSAAMGIKTIGLYGPTDGNRIGPYPLSESRNGAINAPGGDLASLSVDRVLEEVSQRL